MKQDAERFSYPDNLQVGLLLVCLLDLIFFSYYLFVYALPRQHTISDSLFEFVEYRAMLSVTLGIRCAGVALFLLRYRDEAPSWLTLGTLGILVTLLGWTWLVLHKDNVNHFTGVFLFCLGSSAYSISLLKLAAIREKKFAHIRLAMEIFLFLSSAALVIAFVTLWMLEETSGKHTDGDGYDNTEKAYIVEHAAYMTFLLFYATFFLFHTPDPDKSPALQEIFQEEAYNRAESSVALKPLLHPPRV